MPWATASARVAAPSLPRIEATWNFAVWSEMLSWLAISLLPDRRPAFAGLRVRGASEARPVRFRRGREVISAACGSRGDR